MGLPAGQQWRRRHSGQTRTRVAEEEERLDLPERGAWEHRRHCETDSQDLPASELKPGSVTTQRGGWGEGGARLRKEGIVCIPVTNSC